MLSPIIKAIATGEEFEGVDWSEVGYSAVLGALSAGMLTVSQTHLSPVTEQLIMCLFAINITSAIY